MRRYLLPFFLFLLLATGVVQAQLQVNLTIKRRLFVAYEPIEAVVSIRNLAGQEIRLEDAGAQAWFGFTIFREDGRPVPPREIGYSLEPMVIPANGTMRKKVILNELYPVDEFGGYRIQASIYFAPLNQFFQSKSRLIDITEGRAIWRQIVGVPDGDLAGDRREMSVLTFRQPKSNYLYVRVRDANTQGVYCTRSVGRLITGAAPQIMLDGNNHIHVLHLTGPRTYIHTEIGLNGDLLTQEPYLSAKYRPTLKINKASGVVRVAGGVAERGQATMPTGVNIPKISDRPVSIPKP